MTTTRIFAGEMILSSRLADTKGNSGIAYAMEKGRVLVTLPGSDIVGLNTVRARRPRRPSDDRHARGRQIRSERQSTDYRQARLPRTSQPTPTVTNPDAIKLPYTTQVAMQNLIVIGLGPITDGCDPGRSQRTRLAQPATT